MLPANEKNFDFLKVILDILPLFLTINSRTRSGLPSFTDGYRMVVSCRGDKFDM